MQLLAGILVAWAAVNLFIMLAMITAFFAFDRGRHYLWLGLFYTCVALLCLARAAHYLGADSLAPFVCTRLLLTAIVVAGYCILALAVGRSELRRGTRALLHAGSGLAMLAATAICLFGPVANHPGSHGLASTLAINSFAVESYRFTAWAYATLLFSLLQAAAGTALLVRSAQDDRAVRKAFVLGIVALALLGAHDILIYTAILPSIPLGEHGAFLIGLCVLFALFRETELFRYELRASDQVLEETAEHLNSAAVETSRLRPMADLGRLAASLAQQIRAPLAAIGEVTAAMKHPRPGGGTAEGYGQMVERLGEQTRRLARLVDDLLLYSGKGLRARGPVQLGDLVRAALGDALESVSEMSEVEIVTRIEAGMQPLRANAAGLRRALTNLIVNAVQSSTGRGTVEVAARRADDGTDTVLIGVSDSGGGVPEELEEEIFEPYYTSRSTGTGLGLAIARRIAEEHSGSLLLQNRPGQGASFWMKLPLAGDTAGENGESQ